MEGERILPKDRLRTDAGRADKPTNWNAPNFNSTRSIIRLIHFRNKKI